MKKKYFIIKVFYLFFIFLSFLLTNSCAYFKIKELEKINYKQNNLFDLVGLEYKKFANFELYDMHDEIDANYFAFKALMAVKEKQIFIEKPEDWNIDDKFIEEALAEYKNINEILNTDLIYKYPQLTAQIIVGFDCWLEQLEENWQVEDIAKCKSKFKKNIQLIKISETRTENQQSKKDNLIEDATDNAGSNNDLFIINIEIEKVVYFNYDSFDLRDVEKHKLDEIVDYAKNNSSKQIVIYGHTDTKGSNDYNLKLSKNRAKSVEIFLKSKKVSNKIIIRSYGENFPSIKTGDNIIEEKNRRAEIIIN